MNDEDVEINERNYSGKSKWFTSGSLQQNESTPLKILVFHVTMTRSDTFCIKQVHDYQRFKKFFSKS